MTFPLLANGMSPKSKDHVSSMPLSVVCMFRCLLVVAKSVVVPCKCCYLSLLVASPRSVLVRLLASPSMFDQCKIVPKCVLDKRMYIMVVVCCCM